MEAFSLQSVKQKMAEKSSKKRDWISGKPLVEKYTTTACDIAWKMALNLPMMYMVRVEKGYDERIHDVLQKNKPPRHGNAVKYSRPVVYGGDKVVMKGQVWMR